MADVSLAPELNPDDQVQFVDSHRVSLLAGDYMVAVTQTVTTRGQPFGTYGNPSGKFSVLGERFSLNPQDIHAVFPPDGSRGDFQNDLPHVILNRSTLPWERTAADGVTPRPPWLALLVFHQQVQDAQGQPQDEAPLVTASTKTLSGLKASSAPTAPYWPGMTLESGQHDDVQCRAIDVPWGILEPLLPQSQDDLNFRTHTRRRLAYLGQAALTSAPGSDAEAARNQLKNLLQAKGRELSDAVEDPTAILPPGETDRSTATKWIVRDRGNHEEYEIWNPDGDNYDFYRVDHETAVILANRLPADGQRNVVHLVSLEGRYSGGLATDNFDGHDHTTVRLVSLHSWEFFSVEPRKNFTGLLEHLNETPYTQGSVPTALHTPVTFRLPVPTAAEGHTSGQMLRAGFLPLRHSFRRGDRSISWYHGPLVPNELGGTQEETTDHKVTTPGVELPTRAADKLLIYNQTLGMFDVSYAAAWELGRMLTLANRKVALSLYHWKRRHAHSLHTGRQLVDYGYDLMHPIARSPDSLPDDLRRWLDELTLLAHVPFDYLVPDERLLPPESLRIFTVDRVWLECLRDGAFSIGRVLAADMDKDHLPLAEAASETPIPTLSGFLLRSEVVSGFPGLRCDAWNGRPQQGDRNSADLSDPIQKLDLLRMERLSPNVLLCLFAPDQDQTGVVKTLDIHQRAEMLHFGFDEISNETHGMVRLRNAAGEQVEGAEATAEVIDGTTRVVDLGTFADAIEAVIKAAAPIQAAVDAARDAIDAARDAPQAAIDAAINANQAAIDAARDANLTDIEAAQQAVQALLSLRSLLPNERGINSAVFALEMIAGAELVRFIRPA